jgi:hypothetical protein
MDPKRIKTPTGFFRYDWPEASALMKLLTAVLAFFLGALATLLAMIYFQFRLVLFPVFLWLGELNVIAIGCVVGGIAGVVTFVASVAELRRAMKAEELKDRRAKLEAGFPANYKRPKFF